MDAHGRPLRSHVERVVDPTEAAVVRQIFTLYDSGEGLKRIAKQLNAEGAACPKPFVRKDPTKVLPVPGWSPSHGAQPSSRASSIAASSSGTESRKRDDVRAGEPEAAPRVRVAARRGRAPAHRRRAALWQRVESRRREAETLAARFAGGRLSGRPPKTATQNLLAGWRRARCAAAGWWSRRARESAAACRSTSVTATARTAPARTRFRMPVAELNEAVLQAVEEHALTPEAIEQVIHLSERDDVAELQDKLSARAEGHREADRAAASPPSRRAATAASLVAKLRELEARQQAIDREVASLRPVPRLAPAGHRESAGGVAAAAARVDDAGPHRAAADSARAADVHASAPDER